MREESKNWMLRGYEEMMKRIYPRKIIWRGKVPDEFDDVDRKRLVIIPQFTDKWRKTDGEGQERDPR